jgi:hypothetical protein
VGQCTMSAGCTSDLACYGWVHVFLESGVSSVISHVHAIVTLLVLHMVEAEVKKPVSSLQT